MGLLERLKTPGSTGATTPQAGGMKYFNFTFKSLEEEKIEELLTMYKRLLIRGLKIEQGKFNSDCRLSVVNRESKVLFFKLGSHNVMIEGHEYIENFFQIFCESEMWNVFCQRIVHPDASLYSSEENPVTQFTVEYVPDKIGREAVNAYDYVKDMAFSAMKIFEDKDRIEGHINSLRSVLGEGSVDDMVKLKDTWFNLIFVDELSRNLQAANAQKQEDTGLSNPIFELKNSDSVILNKYFSDVAETIDSKMYFKPSVVAVSGKQFAVARVFHILDNSEVVGVEAKPGYIRCYAVSFMGALGFVKAMEFHGMDLVVVSDFKYLELFSIPEEVLKKNIAMGIKAIDDVFMRNAVVQCKGTMEMVKIEKPGKSKKDKKDKKEIF